MAWAFGPKDTLRLLDAKGAALMEFTEVENGMFESERGADGLLFLQTQAAFKVDVRTAEQIVGDWNLLREIDKPLCRLTLSNTANGDAFRVIVKPGCDKTIAAFNPTTWRLDGDQLILSGRGARGGSRKATPPSGSACRSASIRCSWCDSEAVDLRRRGFLIHPESE